MEDKLTRLVQGNSEANRTKWALECKKQGKKVIGVPCSYCPEEIIHAAGMLPWRITGTWRENVPLALAYRPESSCPYCNHVLESLLAGELDFLDGVLFTNRDQDLTRLWDVWKYLDKTPFCHIIHVPYMHSGFAIQFLARELMKAIEWLEEFGGVKITEEALRNSIDVYNQTRSLVARMYELRKREVPPLSGAEVLGIMTAAGVMPKEQFNQELEALLPYLETRKTSLKQIHPRLLLISDHLDHTGYVELIEEHALAAMDAMETGSLYFVPLVDRLALDPVYALAERYIKHHSARMPFWKTQLEQITTWVKEFGIDGVLTLAAAWCHPQTYRIPYFRQELKKLGIPNMDLRREYHLANVGQLRTRIGAFVEMVGVKV